MDYNKMTLAQLRDLAKERGLKRTTALKKQQLIEALLGSETAVAGETAPPRPTRNTEEKRQTRNTEENRQSRNAEENRQTRNTEENSSYRSQEERESQKGRPNFTRRPPLKTDMDTEEERGNRPEKPDFGDLDSGNMANGILDVLEDGFGFIRCENYLSGGNDVYVSPSQIRRFNLRTGDIIVGNIRQKRENEKFSALLYVESVNGYKPYDAQKRKNFADLTPIFPDEKIRLETPGAPVSVRIMDILAPIGKGQRGMIVSQPKTGKTTLLKQISRSIKINEPNMKIIILLIDERPEEVTDFKEYIEGPNVEVIYSTFDEEPEHHIKVAKMVLERAKRLVEHGEDVCILLDSITRLARANNMVIEPSGRTLSGGLDPKALNFPKKFFGAARNMREGGSLTILATALVETGSKMDDVVFEEFKGTGNMEMILDRRLAERRIFPAINIQRSSTRRDDLLLSKEELDLVFRMHREMNHVTRGEENVEEIWKLMRNTRNNVEFIENMKIMLAKQ